MNKLYPLTFITQYKDKIWGGQKIRTVLGKDFGNLPNCGETWEISGVKGNISVVKDGDLAGKLLTELIAEFKEDFLGKKVFETAGNEFPLLIKFLDANDDLSIQVHPNDALAMKRHQSLGKTEMWYVFEAENGAILNTGFNQPLDKETYLNHLNNHTLNEILNFEHVTVGDVYFLPAGRVHYIGKGICLAEIQQTSDITYRIYDFDRKDDQGNLRELHTDLALDAIDFTFHENYKTNYIEKLNEPVSLVKCQYFETNLLHLTENCKKSYKNIDSFVIYICFEGEMSIIYEGISYNIKKGQTFLLPAAVKEIELVPQVEVKFLETYIL